MRMKEAIIDYEPLEVWKLVIAPLTGPPVIYFAAIP